MYFVNVNSDNADSQDGGSGDDDQLTDGQIDLNSFWPHITHEIDSIQQVDCKNQVLPLARIKKIMKLDEDVKMISAEAPLLFAKAAEIFIHELTLRAWIHTEENKRRTLQRNDIALAISKYDQFDFLIDIVPRDIIKPSTSTVNNNSGSAVVKSEPTTCDPVGSMVTTGPPDVQYYLQLAQQTTQPTIVQSGQMHAATLNGPVTLAGAQNVMLGATPTATMLNGLQGVQSQQMQLVQQIVTPTGEIQHVPITIPQNQLNLLRMQVQNQATNQPLVMQQLIQIPNTGGVYLNTATTGTTATSPIHEDDSILS